MTQTDTIAAARVDLPKLDDRSLRGGIQPDIAVPAPGARLPETGTVGANTPAPPGGDPVLEAAITALRDPAASAP